MKTLTQQRIIFEESVNIFQSKYNAPIYIIIAENSGNFTSFSLRQNEKKIIKINDSEATITIETCARGQTSNATNYKDFLVISKFGIFEIISLFFAKLAGYVKSPPRIFKAWKALLHTNKTNSPIAISLSKHVENFIGPISDYSFELSNRNPPIDIITFAKKCATIGIKILNSNDEALLKEVDTKFNYTLKVKSNYTATYDAFEIIKDSISVYSDFDFLVFDKFYNNYSSDFPEYDPILFDANFGEIPILRKINNNRSEDWKKEEKKYKKIPFEIFFDNDRIKCVNTQAIDNQKLISIIIPSRDKAHLIEQCINSIKNCHSKNYEIIIVDNGSIEEKTRDVYASFGNIDIKIIDAPIEFNFSKLCNIGAKSSKGQILVFLNNDVKILDKNLFAKIRYYSNLQNIGIIGAKLLYPDKTIQHCGIYLGIGNGCGHLYVNASEESNYVNDAVAFDSLRSAVTGALLAVRKDVFEKLGGFDEINFPITYNDVDLCLKSRDNGLYNMIINETKIIHYESQSREHDYSPNQIKRRNMETKNFIKIWNKRIGSDPWIPKYVNYSSSKYTLK